MNNSVRLLRVLCRNKVPIRTKEIAPAALKKWAHTSSRTDFNDNIATRVDISK